MADAVNQDRKPVRVKAYGLVPMTKATYLKLQLAGFILLLLALIAVMVVPLPAAWRDQPWAKYVPLAFVVAGILEGIETFIMLRKFR